MFRLICMTMTLVALLGFPFQEERLNAAEIWQADQAPPVSMTVRACTPTAHMGGTVMLACTLTIPEGWHVYWTNPGISGAPTTIEVEGPKGLIVDAVRYPRPMVFEDQSGVTYGYKENVTLLVPVQVPDIVPEDMDHLNLSIRGDWFVCRDRCFIGSDTQSISIPLSRTPDPLESWVAPLLGRHSWPKPLQTRPRTTAVCTDGKLIITGPPTQSGGIGFLPDPTPGVQFGQPEIKLSEEQFFIEIPFNFKPSDALGQKPFAQGLLTFGDKATMTSYQVSVPLDTSEGPDDSTREEQRKTQP